MIILGVDPGSLRTGYGAIRSDGHRHELLDKGVLVPPPRAPLPDRLHFIHESLRTLIARLRPDVLAVEDVFHAVNTRTALVLGHVRGVVLLAGAQAGLSVHAFPPATVKVQVTGAGRADKAQVALMVARLLALPGKGEAGDAADALAVAVCHAHLHLGGAVPGLAARPTAPPRV
jgi:crossover junction endodeoxyribonuclease RuvC